MSPVRPRATRVVSVDPEQPDAQAIADAARVLTHGGLVAFPTETVYGLGANALDSAAVAALFDAKGRPSTDPVIVHLAAADELRDVARAIPPVVDRLASRFWPGPLTLVLRKAPRMPDSITGGLDTIGIRVPAHPVAYALLRAAKVPIVAPSANRFSCPSPTRAEHVLDDLNGAIDVVLDAGPTSVGVESTVVDLTSSPPVVLRPGGVSMEHLRDIIPDVVLASRVANVSDAQRAPGQLLRHYAPRARLTLYVGDAASVVDRLGAEARSLAASGSRVGILAPEEDLMAVAPTLVPLASAGRVRFANFGTRRDPARAARELFAALRSLDAEGVDEILASAPDPHDIGLAIHDRLTRAAEGRVRDTTARTVANHSKAEKGESRS
jgi:L-threonylcarbamoyladenylate synthase